MLLAIPPKDLMANTVDKLTGIASMIAHQEPSKTPSFKVLGSSALISCGYTRFLFAIRLTLQADS
jgi:hypothetical protein